VAVAVEQGADDAAAQHAREGLVLGLGLPVGQHLVAAHHAADVEALLVGRPAAEAGVARRVPLLEAKARGAQKNLRSRCSAAWSVWSTMAAAFTPMAMAIVSASSSRVAPNFSAFLMWPCRQPWHLAPRLAAMATSSFVLRSRTEGL